MSVRKAHNSGKNHLRNVVEYYQRMRSISWDFMPVPLRQIKKDGSLMIALIIEIGHDRAQSVIDSITSSYAAEGQANPMMNPMGPGGAPPFPPPPFGFPGMANLSTNLPAIAVADYQDA